MMLSFFSKLIKRNKKEAKNPMPHGTTNWGSGAMFSLSIDWDHKTQTTSANEVLASLRKHLANWPDKKKFKALKPTIQITYMR